MSRKQGYCPSQICLAKRISSPPSISSCRQFVLPNIPECLIGTNESLTAQASYWLTLHDDDDQHIYACGESSSSCPSDGDSMKCSKSCFKIRSIYDRCGSFLMSFAHVVFSTTHMPDSPGRFTFVILSSIYRLIYIRNFIF